MKTDEHWKICRVAVDMDIHGYIHVWDIRLGHPVDISMDIFIYFNSND